MCVGKNPKTVRTTNLLTKFIHNQSGATAIEYGLIASLLGVAIMFSLQSLGGSLSGTFSGLERAMTAAPKPPFATPPHHGGR